ncbi:MAG: hypothetical protein WC389_19585 [Lutibacter sp.]|jgi:hypothetical protein
MKSEVELNQKILRVNDVLFYIDNYNTEKWVITELFKGGFEAESEYETKSFLYNELQSGWCISENTKKDNELNFRLKYI